MGEGMVAAMAEAMVAVGAAVAAAQGRREGGEWGVPSRATAARWGVLAVASDARAKSERRDCIFETPKPGYYTTGTVPV